jgi:hypothetical protein
VLLARLCCESKASLPVQMLHIDSIQGCSKDSQARIPLESLAALMPFFSIADFLQPAPSLFRVRNAPTRQWPLKNWPNSRVRLATTGRATMPKTTQGSIQLITPLHCYAFDNAKTC